MSVILDALTDLATADGAASGAAYVRQQSKLLSTQVGYTQIEIATKWEPDISTKLSNRAAIVEGKLDAAAGGVVNWSENANVVQNGVSATQLYVIGLMEAEAGQRGTPEQIDLAKFHIGLANEALKTALEVVLLMVSNIREPPATLPVLRSTAVRVQSVW